MKEKYCVEAFDYNGNLDFMKNIFVFHFLTVIKDSSA
jgi:hypothetical protein